VPDEDAVDLGKVSHQLIDKSLWSAQNLSCPQKRVKL